MASDRGDCTLTVVSRYDNILGYASAYPNVHTVYSPLSHLGASFSIRAALQALHDTGFAGNDYFMFMVADQPHISRKTLDAIADAAYSGCLTASASYGDRRGNPVLFSAALADELLALSGDTGGRQVLRTHPEDHIDISAGSPEELEDIDYRP